MWKQLKAGWHTFICRVSTPTKIVLFTIEEVSWRMLISLPIRILKLIKIKIKGNRRNWKSRNQQLMHFQFNSLNHLKYESRSIPRMIIRRISFLRISTITHRALRWVQLRWARHRRDHWTLIPKWLKWKKSLRGKDWAYSENIKSYRSMTQLLLTSINLEMKDRFNKNLLRKQISRGNGKDWTEWVLWRCDATQQMFHLFTSTCRRCRDLINLHQWST